MYTTQLMVSLLLAQSNNHHRMANFQSPQASTPLQDEVNCGTRIIDIRSCEYLAVDEILGVCVELFRELSWLSWEWKCLPDELMVFWGPLCQLALDAGLCYNQGMMAGLRYVKTGPDLWFIWIRTKFGAIKPRHCLFFLTSSALQILQTLCIFEVVNINEAASSYAVSVPWFKLWERTEL